MAKITVITAESAQERISQTKRGYIERAPFRDALVGLTDDKHLELELESGETMRKLKLSVRRASNETGIKIEYGETTDGTLLVWRASATPPAKKRKAS